MPKPRKDQERLLRRMIDRAMSLERAQFVNEKAQLLIALAERDAEIAELATAARSRDAAWLATEWERLNADRRAFEAERKAIAAGRRSRRQNAVTPVKDDQYYASILGLKGRCIRAEIKAAFRAMVVSCHPDRVQSMHPDIVSVATRKMQDVNEAWMYLSKNYEIA